MFDICNKRVALITGKGGVGRTTITAALGRAAAKRGLRVLLTEIGEPDGDYTPLARLFGHETLPGDPIGIGPNLWGCTLWPRRGHELFFKRVIPVGPIARAAANNESLRKLLDSAPSFREMGVFYHMFWLLEATRPDGKFEFDLVIIDMPATGHTLGLTGLRQRLLSLMPTGPIAKILNEGAKYFHDPEVMGAYIVTLPETLPVTESLELAEGLQASNTPVGGVFLNRMLPDPFTEAERAALAPFSDQPLYGMNRYLRVPAGEAALKRLRDSTALPIEVVAELPLAGLELIEGMAIALAMETNP